MSGPAHQRKNLLHLEKEHWWPPVYSHGGGFARKIKIALFRFLDLQAGTIWDDLSAELPRVQGVVLDVGCGIQPFRHMFSPEVKYIGIDTVDSKAHFGYEAPDTLYYSGDKWPLKDKQVDFILCTETLEHIPEPRVFLSQAYRVLRPGGRLLLTVPFAARWHFIPYDYWRYTPSGLDDLLKKAGFTNARVFARGNQLTVACYKVMAFIFSLLFPMGPGFFFRGLSRFLGLLSLPLLLIAATLANLTKGKDGSVDCLGYTASADRPTRNTKK
jgi:SAM-dependent methyltransferase